MQRAAEEGSWDVEYGDLKIVFNDSTCPAMDQSRPEPSSPVQVQSRIFLDWDQTDPRC